MMMMMMSHVSLFPRWASKIAQSPGLLSFYSVRLYQWALCTWDDYFLALHLSRTCSGHRNVLSFYQTICLPCCAQWIFVFYPFLAFSISVGLSSFL